jgi:hypothetical protein
MDKNNLGLHLGKNIYIKFNDNYEDITYNCMHIIDKFFSYIFFATS